MQSTDDSRFRKRLNGTAGIRIFGWVVGIGGLVGVVVIISFSFWSFGQWSFDEVARIPNPKTFCDAVLVETNGGATTSFGYQVFVLPRGQKPKRGGASVAKLYGAWRSEHAYGVNLRWLEEDALAIEYLEAKHADQQNGEVNINGHTIRITMKPGISDSTAPAGGMLHNLEKQQHP